MVGEAAISIVDSYVDYMFLRSRPGGLANESKTQEVNMKINRFLALSGYLEGVVLSDVLLWMGHMEVHDSSQHHSPAEDGAECSNGNQELPEVVRGNGLADARTLNNVSVNLGFDLCKLFILLGHLLINVLALASFCLFFRPSFRPSSTFVSRAIS
ncbi:hypothetical protein DPMN_040496 [Dreissena polymorpha]|uniref:Uncharacterized protein n=1 Tax=Dreissena polymorpha TaxID=45954 RepID=A0A9D4CVE9_DREPO|nr:hypothetical protein DPMN_040496 [Dreissena polymorpha]